MSAALAETPRTTETANSFADGAADVTHDAGRTVVRIGLNDPEPDLPAGRPVTVLRTGLVLTDDLRRRWSRFTPLLGHLRGPVVTPGELAEFTATLGGDDRPGVRRVTLLGENRPLREALAGCGPTLRVGSGVAEVDGLRAGDVEQRGTPRTPASSATDDPAGRAVRDDPTPDPEGRATVLGTASRWLIRRRGWAVEELNPTSRTALLELCRPWNRPHVRLAGYNNGVTHFGWRFPGKTVVSTVHTGGRVRVRDDVAVIDAGMTLLDAARALREHGKRFHVLPNFSYVGVGTPFFVPVHGSGSAVSTLGDTIEEVTYYDPDSDRIVRARRGEPAFDGRMYDMHAGILLLRLRYRVCDPVRLRPESARLESPTADALWETLDEPGAANVEVRKAQAADEHVTVLRHHAVDDDGAVGDDSQARDRLGRLWDRIEETPVAGTLFHKLVRTFGYHVELFLRREEFRTFWESHRGLPLNKIQLRMVRADGMPHSPVRDADAVSADLFMHRRHREEFRTFMHARLPDVRVNPGKQSL